MGTWGTGVFDDDLALDLKDEYRELVADGLSGPEATRLVPVRAGLDEVEWTGAGDAHIKLRVESEAGLVHAHGKAHFALRHPCVRCLNPVPFDVPLDVDLRLARRWNWQGHEVETALVGQNLGQDYAEFRDTNVFSRRVYGSFSLGW